MEREVERLEQDLERLGRAATLRETPNIASAVLERLEGPPERRLAPGWSLAGVAAVAVLVTFIALVSIAAPARNAVADIFGQINIFELDEEPPAGTPTAIEGEEVTLAKAEDLMGFELLLPDGRAPARVLYQEFGGFQAAVLFYDNPVFGEYALFETSGSVGKGLAPEASWERVNRIGPEAYWLEGLRIVQYETQAGRPIEESVRATDTNTLIWTRSGFVFRIEGDVSLDDAVEIANSLR